MSRKDDIKAMLSGREQKLPVGNCEPPVHVRSGAVGAMGKSLGQIADAAHKARAMVAMGAAVVEIDPSKLVPSFVADRLADQGPDYQRLVEAIRGSEQRSPILVRPHPDGSDRYQIAFGHRRVRVLAELGRPVRAVVQALSDEQLVVIQGQENAARTDLSYIERGLFALTLEQGGYDRRVIMAALGMEKTQLSKLLSLAHTIPRHVAEAIGPAPKAGRPRWADLAERIAQPQALETLDKLFKEASFCLAESDDRFNQAFSAVAQKPSRRAASDTAVETKEGKKIASIGRRSGVLTITIDRKVEPAFADFVAQRFAALYETFRMEHQKEKPPDVSG